MRVLSAILLVFFVFKCGVNSEGEVKPKPENDKIDKVGSDQDRQESSSSDMIHKQHNGRDLDNYRYSDKINKDNRPKDQGTYRDLSARHNDGYYDDKVLLITRDDHGNSDNNKNKDNRPKDQGTYKDLTARNNDGYYDDKVVLVTRDDHENSENNKKKDNHPKDQGTYRDLTARTNDGYYDDKVVLITRDDYENYDNDKNKDNRPEDQATYRDFTARNNDEYYDGKGSTRDDYGYSANYRNKEKNSERNRHLPARNGYYDDDDKINEKQEYQPYYETLDNKTIKKLDEIFGLTGPTANDEPENLIRPCALEDWQCIRNYFASNSQCKPTHGPIPDPFIIEKNTVLFPAFNITANFINFVIRGLSSAKINDFYVNKKSGNLVLAIDVQNLNITSPRVYLRYRRTAKESIVLADTGFVLFRTATFTAVIPKVPKLRLDDADIHGFFDEARPAFAFGPNIYKSTDPDVIDANAQFFTLLPIAVRESLVLLSPLITGIYIQENICKFPIKLISL